MTDEVIKWLVSTGIGGVIGGWALIELRGMRREQGEAAEKNIDWQVAIHSRLSSLGADSIPPPVAQPEPQPRRGRSRRSSRMYRFQTAPLGHPTEYSRPDTDSEKEKP
jgi:hypothetical protein